MFSLLRVSLAHRDSTAFWIEVFQTREIVDVVFSLVVLFVFAEVTEAVEDIQACIEMRVFEIASVTDDPGGGNVALPAVSNKCYFFIVKSPDITKML